MSQEIEDFLKPLTFKQKLGRIADWINRNGIILFIGAMLVAGMISVIDQVLNNESRKVFKAGVVATWARSQGMDPRVINNCSGSEKNFQCDMSTDLTQPMVRVVCTSETDCYVKGVVTID